MGRYCLNCLTMSIFEPLCSWNMKVQLSFYKRCVLGIAGEVMAEIML